MRIKHKDIIITVILFTVICLGISLKVADAKEKETSGDYFGMHWNYDETTKTLSITGKGKMHDYFGDEYYDECPWWYVDGEVAKLIIGEGITHIGDFAFIEGIFEVNSVILPDSITSIGSDVFAGGVNIESIILPNHLKTIRAGAFAGCYELKEIIIPDSVKSMGEYVLSDCTSLRSVTLSKNLKTLPVGTFRNCSKLESVKIPDSITSIGSNAFENSGISSIVIPKNVTAMKSDLFIDCKYLKTIKIKSSKLNKISKHTFSGVSEDTVILVPKSKLKAYKEMFYKAGLSKKVKITYVDSVELG